MQEPSENQRAERFARFRAWAEAHPGISDLAERRAAKLVAVLTLVLFALTAISAGVGLLLDARAFLARLPVMIALLAWHGLTYALNRSRYYRTAAALLCVGPVWSNAAVGFADANDPIWYAFMPLSALLASTLLSFASALYVSALSVATTAIVLIHAQESVSRDRATLTLAYVIFFSAVVLATARFRGWVENGRRAELLALERRLAETQRMEALGRLAAGVAHDFNNFLMVIQGNVELARIKQTSANLDEIESAATRATQLIAQLLSFAREQPNSPTTLRLDEAIRNLEPIIARLAGKNVELSLALNARWPIEADPVQLDQILLNLVANARDAMPNGGQIALATRDVAIASERPHGAPTGDYVVLSVRDSGAGMDADTIARAFEPFFTTKERGKGSGLGLATVKGIVTERGGALEIESAPGRGTTFHVFLPRSPGDTRKHAGAGLVVLRSSS